ncbi:sulfurtransferase complex subunit TusB [Cobetia crustatorum]|uniref:Sulfurtransferase complex subunit TusB n=2 Tax=Halomonadaceae TaxID=28256 RepID=A0A558HI99_9GAMM|nr:sulfurtransferase complex subunit TusB [Cobetia crustatorum]
MNLHLLNRSPFSSRVYEDVLNAMGSEDQLLLIEDGVNGALSSAGHYLAGLEGRLFALREDLESRGLSGRCSESVIVVDVDGFVALTEAADKTISWF